MTTALIALALALRSSLVSIGTVTRSSLKQASPQGDAMRYALMICDDEKAVITPEEPSARVAASTSFNDQMRARRVLPGSERLHPATAASTRPILVIGATGRHGGTGATVARELRSRGVPVRALCRVDDERAAALRALGIETVVGDLHDRRSLVQAVDGVEVAYFTYPGADGIVDAAGNFASAGREAGLKRVVVMSMAVSSPESPSRFARRHWLAEQILEWAGFSCLQLRVAAFFFENLELYHRAEVITEGVIRNSYSQAEMPWIAGEDAGKLGVAALLHPERFGDGGAIHLSPTQRHSYAEIAQIMGDYLGRRVRHETIARDVWRDRIIELGERDDRIDSEMAEHISTMGATIGSSPLRLKDLVDSRALIGAEPRSLLELLESGRLSFAATAGAAPGVSAS